MATLTQSLFSGFANQEGKAGAGPSVEVIDEVVCV